MSRPSRGRTADLHSTSANTSRLTAPVAGVYRITANVSWGSNPDGQREIDLLKNGGGIPEEFDRRPAAAVAMTTQLSTDLKLAVGDYLEVAVEADKSNGDPEVYVPRSFTMSWVAPG
jgi:hypothetical protein